MGEKETVKKISLWLLSSILILLVGCGKIAPNPYELTKEARKIMRPDQQATYIQMMKSLEELVADLNDTSLSYSEEMNRLKKFYENCPKDWTWESDEPIDLAWRYVMSMLDGFMGCVNYENYADCKDAVDALGKEITDYFEQRNERRKALIVKEDRFDELYEAGKKSQLK